jgi:exopolysaccharide/PEP-CTERM locus tyrosine autokinase
VSIVERAINKIHERISGAADQNAAVAGSSATGSKPAAPVRIRASRREYSLPRVTFDRDKLRQSGLLPAESDEVCVQREFRRIKRPLVARALAKGPDRIENASVLMVASAMPGEGKTFTAMNLALSLAREHDISVLLVDADLPKPQISQVLGIADTPGLLDALADPAANPDAFVHDTDVENLQVLGAGTPNELATELLASERMQAVVTELRRADPRRIMVFDSPPLLLTTESRELGAIAGQVILVVRAEHTPRQAVYDAIEQFDESKQVGIVLNDLDGARNPGYYYGYGQYGTYPAQVHAPSGSEE